MEESLTSKRTGTTSSQSASRGPFPLMARIRALAVRCPISWAFCSTVESRGVIKSEKGSLAKPTIPIAEGTLRRSEERRVGKECRSRWGPYHKKKKRGVTRDE